MESAMAVVEAISIAVASLAVILGIDAWKREFIGKRRIERAETTLAKFHEVCDAIAFIRNPWSNTEEGKTRKREPNETDEESALLDRGYIVFERYETKKDVFVEFNTLKYRFMASFGRETGGIFDKTNQVLNSIFVSARMLGTYYWQRQGRVPMEPDEGGEHLAEMHKHERIFWDVGKENDEVRNKLANILASLERVTEPVFGENMRSYGLLTWPWFKRGNKANAADAKNRRG